MRRAIAVALALLLADGASADSLRIATFQTGLSADGPGLLLRDILRDDPRITLVLDMVAGADADAILLQDVDYDAGGAVLSALTDRLADIGAPYPFAFQARPNTGMATGLDMDGDGRTGGPRDSQGFGRFAGQGGMALLSRLPIDTDAALDFAPFLWRDLPGAIPPDGPFPSARAAEIRRLSSTAHWVVPLRLANGDRLSLLAWHATPPVFDGPEDLNGRRNHDEAAFWLRYLDGALPEPPPDGPLVVLGDANLDPVDGDGRAGALNALLAHPRLQDPLPSAPPTTVPAGVNLTHRGAPHLDTADWDDAGPGDLRVSYVLPSRDLTVLGAGLLRPDPALPDDIRPSAAVVWVDIDLPPALR
ncbi:hypothetical protein OCGS_1391 [Oceaniovalibus guishaninsula JLT2003]|uniref:Endonuclease/exonuclease/phosphatase domain-containing protein n=1 Tax=Oceaniovalibus guishaninsula JLT2003 TaxID=1231392 RepID=K2HAJ9_9RHOB|nr:endonuclease/exonuclease/phosphatase family protein [Oceaniovalibus guishaninsula]EKE44553.1 hypothetical protein OCGS_1391 [Oceaniovalibus guishaninsula JLT2003]